MYKGRRLRKLVPVKSVHGSLPVRVQETVKATHVAVAAPERAHATAVPSFDDLSGVFRGPPESAAVPILEEDFDLEFEDEFDDE